MTITEFESRWKSLQENYSVEENSWLSNMYKICQHWAKVYLKDTFFAGMTTSGQSESIHSYFDGLITNVEGDSAQIDDEDGEDKTQQPGNIIKVVVVVEGYEWKLKKEIAVLMKRRRQEEWRNQLDGRVFLIFAQKGHRATVMTSKKKRLGVISLSRTKEVGERGEDQRTE
ncbi:hypothetical protein RJ639_018247 [Escallonia herrerae]|uniref:Protein FAR1-RELATED SEQUENCE n=1 Tax=Escallonia herrerae TaxID=1293975 RepID=A0AA88V6L5_9ASTE|nr:hypothetical protein RJ639_018247 [Escallonia herrerae]